MKIKDLLNEWEQRASHRQTAKEYPVRLTIHDAARVHALAEMYPGRRKTDLITDLLSAALDELERVLPYVQGQRVIAEDDQNDPIYEDAGKTPRLFELTRKYEQELLQETAESAAHAGKPGGNKRAPEPPSPRSA